MAKKDKEIVKKENFSEIEIGDDFLKVWAGLTRKKQEFFLEWWGNGHNCSAAARAIGIPHSSAGVRGMALLRSEGIKELCELLAESTKANFLRAMSVYSDAMRAEIRKGVPDHSTRIRAATDMLKADGQFLEKAKIEHTGNMAVKHIYELPAKKPLEIDADVTDADVSDSDT